VSAARPTDARHVTIVGAGIVGVIAAVLAQRSGLKVTIIDKLEPGRGCSYANGAAISPDFCVPIAAPDMLRKVPRWLADPNGPLYLRWSYLPHAFSYLLHWAGQSRAEAVLRNAAAMRALHKDALNIYKELLGPAMGDLITVPGAAMIYRAPLKQPGGELARRIYETYGVEARILRPSDLRNLDPELSDVFKSGLFFPASGHTTNPFRLVTTLAEEVVRNGGEIRRAEVSDIETDDGRARAIATGDGRLPVDSLVIAAGIGGRKIAARLGDRLPMIGERGYFVSLPMPGVVPPVKISDRDLMFGLTPLETGLRISGTVELDSPEAPMNAGRAGSLLAHAKIMYPRLCDDGAEFGMGVRPTTPDSLPFVGRATRFANVFYAFGHGHFGLNGAPATGRLVADFLTGRTPSIDPSPYRPLRFSNRPESAT
jgi:D-amino-acid dehydrogenase